MRPDQRLRRTAAALLLALLAFFNAPADARQRRPQNPRAAARWSSSRTLIKYISSGTGGATHGAPYRYDTHVPLIIMGAQVRNYETYP